MIIPFKTIDNLMEEVGKLKQAYDLLEQVWLEHGPYGEDPIPDELRYKMNDFFDFDDSE